MNEKLSFAILWLSDCNDVFGAMIFNEDEYDFGTAMRIFADENLNLEAGDTFQLVTTDDESMFERAVKYIGEETLNQTQHYAYRAGSCIEEHI